MASRLKLSVVEIIKDPIDLPRPREWSLHAPFDARDPSWWVGRDSPCAFIVAHPTVSGTQFLLRPQGNRFILRNLGKYGTYVDGMHLTGDAEAELGPQASIQAGAVYMRAEMIEDSPFTGTARDDDPWTMDEVDIVDVWGEPEERHPETARSSGPRTPSSPSSARNYVTDPGLRSRVAGDQTRAPVDPVIDRILAAAGIPERYRQRAAEVVKPEDIGQMLAAWVKGARSVQGVKREIKESHRLEATMSLDGSINPLTKAIPAEEILSLLLGFEGPLYARGQDAVREWFTGLVQHEFAIPDAVRKAWINHVAQMSPSVFAERAEDSGVLGKVSRAHRLAAHWQAFEDFYERELKDANAGFRRQFLPSFRDAYSEAMSRAVVSKKAKRSD